MTKTKQWTLKSYAHPHISEDLFAIEEVDVPEIQEGEVSLKALYISVDPYMRNRLTTKKSYFAPFVLNESPDGFMVCEVVESKASELSEGDYVQASNLKWRLLQVSPAKGLTKIDKSVPPSVFLGTLGLTGLSAYLPLKNIAKPTSGEIVFVSGAAGAVGMAVGQLCKIYGCTVIGSAGSAEKVELIKKMGFDHAFNYKEREVNEALSEYAPDGVDIYWDNVGGPTLEAVLDHMRMLGRIVCCGQISQYDLTSEEKYGIKNTFQLVNKQLHMEGFLVVRWVDEFPEAVGKLAEWYKAGKLDAHETVVEGFERVPEALCGLFKGVNIGKMVVKVADV